MSWKRLLEESRIKPHKTTRTEIEELRLGFDVKLKDARVEALSADTRYVTAYGAALLVAKIALACSGYRLDSKTGGHHKTAFEALPLALGASAKEIASYFQVCRRKRNEIDYDRAFVVSDAEANEIIERTSELRAMIEKWIRAKHSALS